MIVVRRLGLTAYPQTLEQMRARVKARAADRSAAPDELWLTEHEPVFTLGFASRTEHLLDPGTIPVVKTERGGQVTYHGPGQAVAYVLLDLRRRRLGVRELVSRLERGIIDCLAGYGVVGLRKAGAPGIYVQPRTPGAGAVDEPLAKIASIGLKVSGGLTWHGVAVNGCMDLSPFRRIDPCGYRDLRMTDLKTEAGAHCRGVVDGRKDTAGTCGEAYPDPAADLSERLAAAICAAIDG